MKINYKSDFELDYTLLDEHGQPIAPPDCPWKLVLSVGNPLRNSVCQCDCGDTRNFVAEYDGENYHNCVVQNDVIRVFADNHGLPCGQLWATFITYEPDQYYGDEEHRVYTPQPTDVELVSGAGDDATAAQIAVTANYVLYDAYYIAAQNGYEGTPEAYYAALVALPNAIEQAVAAAELAEQAKRDALEASSRATEAASAAEGAARDANTATETANAAAATANRASETAGNAATTANNAASAANSAAESATQAASGVGTAITNANNAANTANSAAGDASAAATLASNAASTANSAAESATSAATNVGTAITNANNAASSASSAATSATNAASAANSAAQSASSVATTIQRQYYNTMIVMNNQINELIDGKAMMAAALTDRGYPTSATDSSASMAQKIENMAYDAGWLAQIGYSEQNDGGVKDAVDYSKAIKDGWNPSNTTRRFTNDKKLTFFPMVDTSNFTSFANMFNGCLCLNAIPNIDTSNVVDMSNAFAYTIIKEFPHLDMSLVRNTTQMFYNCKTIEKFTATTDVLTTCNGMFKYSDSIKEVGELKTQNCTSFYEMFWNAPNIQKITKIDISSISNDGDFFSSANSLTFALFTNLGKAQSKTTFHNNFFPKLTVWGSGSETNRQSLVDTLLTYSFDRATADYSACTIKLHADTLARLTAEEIAAITAKGYTLTS